MSLKVKHFFDEDTFTLTYLVYDEASKDTILIDPVLDYDPATGKISFESIKLVEKFITEEGLNLHMILETHAHADHLTGAAELKKMFPRAQVAIGKEIKAVQDIFGGVFNDQSLNEDFFDLLLTDDQELVAGNIKIKAIHTPGHTPACYSFLIEDNLFTGDALFMPDSGTGRCDFPAGSAKDLYHSIHDKIYGLPGETKIFVGHDYGPNGRDIAYLTTVKDSKENNIQLKAQTTETEYVEMREARDKTLKAPRLLLPSIQVNVRGGQLPEQESNGTRYIKIPLKGDV